MVVKSIQAIVFDIGGVLEITPDLGVRGSGLGKPDPGIYALACARLAVEPAQMVFLDDSEPCVEGARQAGTHAVLYQDNAQAIRDIEDLLAQ